MCCVFDVCLRAQQRLSESKFDAGVVQVEVRYGVVWCGGAGSEIPARERREFEADRPQEAARQSNAGSAV